MSPSARLVKLGDKIHNCGDLSTDPPIGWSKEIIEGYHVWSYAVCLNLFGICEKLDERAKAIFEPYGLIGISSEELTERLKRYYSALE